jgi:predicted ribosome quality control (RQC) complex YloA/Tae2 family protein
MFNNYLYLLRCVTELRELVANTSIKSIYTQEKNKLFFHIPLVDLLDNHLIVSVAAKNSYLSRKEIHYKSKKNVMDFFSNHIPDKIRSVSIAQDDRIIKIKLENSNLFFLIRGTNSNVILIKNDEISSFKKESQESLINIKDEVFSKNYIDSFEDYVIDISSVNLETFIKKYPFIDKNIQNDLLINSLDWKTRVIKILESIFYDDISVFFNVSFNKVDFMPSTFNEAQNLKEVFTFNSYFDALNKFLSLQASLSKIKPLAQEFEKALNKKIENLANKINGLSGKLEEGSKEKEYFSEAQLLLENINLIQKGMKEIVLRDHVSESNIKIKLVEKYSPYENVEMLFEKARNERISFEKSKELIGKLKVEYESLLQKRDELENSPSSKNIQNLRKSLKIKANVNSSNKIETHGNFRHFLVDGKYNVYVGKDSKNNDLLTTRFAKQNDYWFHARSVSGSHVVLRVDNSKEPIPKSILKKAASIAAFYSKAKTSKLVSVSYTLKKYVSKSKHMPLGQVALLKEQVLLVSPEIPKDCEFITDM